MLAYRLPAIVLPSPVAVVAALVELVRHARILARRRRQPVRIHRRLRDRRRSLGIAVGVLMGESRRFRMMATPVVESLRFIVPFAWIPLTILWFGTSFTGKILLVAYAVFFVMVVSTARAIAHVEPTLSRVGTMLGMGRWRLAWQRASARGGAHDRQRGAGGRGDRLDRRRRRRVHRRERRARPDDHERRDVAGDAGRDRRHDRHRRRSAPA